MCQTGRQKFLHHAVDDFHRSKNQWIIGVGKHVPYTAPTVVNRSFCWVDVCLLECHAESPYNVSIYYGLSETLLKGRFLGFELLAKGGQIFHGFPIVQVKIQLDQLFVGFSRARIAIGYRGIATSTAHKVSVPDAGK